MDLLLEKDHTQMMDLLLEKDHTQMMVGSIQEDLVMVDSAQEAQMMVV
jgi:urease accessory protein UreE